MKQTLWRIYKFGSYSLDERERRLVCEGKQVALTPKAFDTLLMLAQHAGHILGKQEMMERICPGPLSKRRRWRRTSLRCGARSAKTPATFGISKRFLEWDTASCVESKSAIRVRRFRSSPAPLLRRQSPCCPSPR